MLRLLYRAAALCSCVCSMMAAAQTLLALPTAEDPVVRLAWAGDVMLADGPGRLIRRGGDPFRWVAPLLGKADLRIANLECVVAQSGKAVDKPWTFKARPAVLKLLRQQFDLVSLANNHSGDFGRDAFAQMLGLLDQAGLAYVGGGMNLRQAHQPVILRHGGLRIAILAYDDFFPRWFEAGPETPGVAWADDEQIVWDIRQAHQQADLVIPFMHWGQEHEPKANARQRALARRMIDAGANAVVGSHPHVVQDTESYRGKPIIYSLGNFVFDGFESPSATTGAVLEMSVTRRGVASWRMVNVHLDRDGSPHPE